MLRRHRSSALASLAILLLLLTFPATALRAQDILPSARYQEIVIRTSVLTLNDANITNNYTILRARTSAQFQRKFTVEQVQQNFQPFRDRKIVLWSAATDPVRVKLAEFTSDGQLHLVGQFTTPPDSDNIGFDLEFLVEDHQFVITGIIVSVTPKGN